jgi:hypothetical protein
MYPWDQIKTLIIIIILTLSSAALGLSKNHCHTSERDKSTPNIKYQNQWELFLNILLISLSNLNCSIGKRINVTNQNSKEGA